MNPVHCFLAQQVKGLLPADMHAPTHYEIAVPPGVSPGESFQANVGGVLMNVTVPEGCASGSLIQIAGPSGPIAAGVPIIMEGMGTDASGGGGYRENGSVIAAGYPVPNTVSMGRVYAADGLAPPEVAYVEVEEISPAGWMCLIVGCFACPGLNLLGLCMRERRLVPVSHVY